MCPGEVEGMGIVLQEMRLVVRYGVGRAEQSPHHVAAYRVAVVPLV